MRLGLLLEWKWRGVLGHIDVAPFALFDAFTNLRRGLAFASLFVGVEIFTHADVAARAVFADETIEQAAMALALVTMAIAGLLVEDFFYPGRNRISIDDDG